MSKPPKDKKHPHPSNKKNILFLLKENSYGSYGTAKSGLLNSVLLLIKSIEYYKLANEVNYAICFDGNSIDKFLHKYKPDICFIEAIWVTGKKFTELVKLHPKVKFVVRIHSNIPFLQMEGIAMQRLKEYSTIPNVTISFNNKDTNDYFTTLFQPTFLPNVYFDKKVKSEPEVKSWVDIGCFGSIRPLKNQLIQAVAAMNYGYNNNKTIHFHINTARVEQGGEPVLKNIRALFENTPHKLIEYKWLSHDEFLSIVSKMDIGLQVSLTESFNIVTADFVTCDVPIVVSNDITWMPQQLQVNPTNAQQIEDKIKEVLKHPDKFSKKATKALIDHNSYSIEVWKTYLLQ